jgi:hypothetical protein
LLPLLAIPCYGNSISLSVGAVVCAANANGDTALWNNCGVAGVAPIVAAAPVAVGNVVIGGNGLTVLASEAITNLDITAFGQTLTQTQNFPNTGNPAPASAMLDYTFFPYGKGGNIFDPNFVGTTLAINFLAYVNGNPNLVIVNDPNAGFFNSATPQSGEHVVDAYNAVEFPFPVNSITIVLTIGTPRYFTDGSGIGVPDPELLLNNSAYAQVESPEPASLTLCAAGLLGLAVWRFLPRGSSVRTWAKTYPL